MFSLETPGAKLNYGVNKVRFPNPVRVGSRIRSTISVADVADLPTGKQLTLQHVIEIEGEASLRAWRSRSCSCCPEGGQFHCPGGETHAGVEKYLDTSMSFSTPA